MTFIIISRQKLTVGGYTPITCFSFYATMNIYTPEVIQVLIHSLSYTQLSTPLPVIVFITFCINSTTVIVVTANCYIRHALCRSLAKYSTSSP